MNRLDEAQARIKIARRSTNNLRYTDDTTLMAESKEEPKNLLMKMKEESEKAGLKLNIQNMKIIASSPTTSWQIDGETVETMTDFIFWAPKSLQMVTSATKLKDVCLLLGRKAMTNRIFKNRDITLATKVHIVKAMVFPSSHVSDQISRSVVSDSLRPHESQHARPPCPLPTPGVHQNSCDATQPSHPCP